MSSGAAIWGVAAVVARLVVLVAAEARSRRGTHRPLSRAMGFNDEPQFSPLGTEALDMALFHKEGRRLPLLHSGGLGTDLAAQTDPYRPQSPNPFQRDAS